MSEINVVFDTGQEFICDFNTGQDFDCEMDGIIAGDYEGPYEVIPSTEEQTLATANKTLTLNVVVKPIPSNYGLITWNGSELTVS